MWNIRLISSKFLGEREEGMRSFFRDMTENEREHEEIGGKTKR